MKFMMLIGLVGATLLAAAAEFDQAVWIAPPADAPSGTPLPLFRKEFVIPKAPVRATLRIIGLGDFDARINGSRIAPLGINQPWSQYEKTLFYREFNVGSLLSKGTNCLGVLLGNSFWHNPPPPKGRYNKDGPQRIAEQPLLLRAELRLEFAGGKQIVIGTDDSWTTAPGPVTFSHIYAGEDYDARKQPAGWDRAGFSEPWAHARLASAPPGKIAPVTFPGIEPFERDAPVEVKESAPGVFVYTFPRNTAGQLNVQITGGKPGSAVQFRCGEHKRDGRLFGAYTAGGELVTDGRSFTHQWIFFYFGMQFVEVTGAVPEGTPNPAGLPVIKRLTMVSVRAALPETGRFTCSSALYNDTQKIIDQAVRANMNWVMTDCPHREKLGWLECAYLLQPTFLYRYDGNEWFSKIAGDLRDAQEPSGRVTTVAPSYPAGRFPGAFTWTVEWGAAAVLSPWTHYEWYGDKKILSENFDMMRRFVDYIGQESKDGVAPSGLGDWYDYGHGQPPGPSRFTPTELSATATWALCALRVADAAAVLGRTEDAKTYRELHSRIARDFQRHFQDPATRTLKNTGSPQCANAMALCADVVPAADRHKLITGIIADLEKRDWQQTPGDVGHVYLIRALAQGGRSDILHKVYSRDGLGSYGGILKKGLTSLPETWDAMMDGYQSLNHCMLGHVQEWYYGYVAGIRQDFGSTGWDRVIIGPNPGDLTSAEGSCQTPHGKIVSRWHRKGGKFILEAEVPKGVEARAILPSGKSVPLTAGKRTVLKE